MEFVIQSVLSKQIPLFPMKILSIKGSFDVGFISIGWDLNVTEIRTEIYLSPR